jgi:hypothetical protein
MGGRANGDRRRRGRRRGRSADVEEPSAERDGPPAEVWDRLGGYRLLRAIGRGERCAAYLAAGDDGPVVVKAYGPDADRDRLVDEVASLTAIASPHVVAVLDVVAAPGDQHGVVLERLSSVTMADWLRSRRGLLETGEVVTASVSVVRAVRAVHAAGWAHGSVSAANIRFDDTGCPVLLGFTDAVRATPSALGADWEQCHRILETILTAAESLDVGDADPVCTAIRGLGSVADQEQLAVEALESALFSLGPPAPLVLLGPPSRLGASSSASSTRAVVPATGSATDGPAGAHEGEPPGAESKPGETARARLLELASAAMEHGVGRAVAPRLRRFASRHRRPIAVAVGAAVIVTLIALFAMPATPAGRAQAPTTTPADSGPARGAARSADAEDRSSAEHTARTSTTPGTSTPPAADEDPVKAAHRLLQRRHRCLDARDPSCLTETDQAGSPLLETDRALITGHGEAEPAPSLSRLSLSETLGNAAIIAIAPADQTTKPASALLIKTEAGWRLRALFEN